MKSLFFVLTIFSLFFAYKSDAQTTTNYSSETLKVKQVGKNIYIHVSFLETQDYGKVAANGMVYFNNDEAIVFDTPVNNEASKELINWIKNKQEKNIKAVVVTHFHNDCLGGLKTFHEEGIPSYANQLTIALAKKDKAEAIPQQAFNKTTTLNIGNSPVLVKFFGEGHTRDNVIGYIEKEETLFGGCLVKTLKARKGYLGDANIQTWSNTIDKIKKEFPNLKLVIPGHGKHGDMALLNYTSKLFSVKK